MKVPTDTLAELQLLAPTLNDLSREDIAEIRYVLAWDALLWSDELPLSFRGSGDSYVLPFLLKYRTQIIRGEADGTWEVWALAKKTFPSWPGFHDGRCRPNEELVRRYNELSTMAWEEIEGDLEA